MDTSNALALPRNGRVAADYERRGYSACATPPSVVVLRHPNGGMITVLANGETRGGDKAGPALNSPDDWWGEPTYIAPE